jgi:hypothetical protein
MIPSPLSVACLHGGASCGCPAKALRCAKVAANAATGVFAGSSCARAVRFGQAVPGRTFMSAAGGQVRCHLGIRRLVCTVSFQGRRHLPGMRPGFVKSLKVSRTMRRKHTARCSGVWSGPHRRGSEAGKAICRKSDRAVGRTASESRYLSRVVSGDSWRTLLVLGNEGRTCAAAREAA